MQKIPPFLWFDNQAEEAMNFYVSIFKNSKVLTVNRYGDLSFEEMQKRCDAMFSARK